MALDAPPLLMRRRQLLAAAETTTGTVATLDTTSGNFFVYNAQFRPIIPPVQRPAMDSSEAFQSVRGATHAELEFDCDIIGSASGVPVWASTFLPACNMVLTGSTYTFVTQPTTIKTISILFNESGRKRQMTGCLGDWTIPFKAGEIARIHFRFMGLLAADTDGALILPTLPTVVPPRWAQGSGNGFIWSLAADGISAGTYSPRVSTAEFRAGNNVVMRQDANADSGFRSALITSRDPVCVADPESALVATFSWTAAHLNASQAALTAVLGTTAGNKLTVSYQKASIRERPGGEREGIVTEGGLVWQANRNGTTIDDDCRLLFA